VADPNRPFRANRVEQLYHVGDDFLLRIVSVTRIDARAPVPTHVRCKCLEANAGERGKIGVACGAPQAR
jgi:hypothetical protein